MRRILMLVLAAAVFGCGGSGPKTVPAKGTVKFADGTVPVGDVALIRFDPVGGIPLNQNPNQEGAQERHAASGTIQADGAFTLTTFETGDGALPGDYKVVLTVFKNRDTRERLLADKYYSAETTPLTASVTSSGPNEFSFTLDKR